MSRTSETIRVDIQKVFYYGEFSGFEMDVFYNDENIGGGTAPTYYGVSDMASEILYDYLRDIEKKEGWFDDDANEPKRQESISKGSKKARD